MAEHWRCRVTMDSADPKLLGECENGDLWVPMKGEPGRWHARFNPIYPPHWRYWLRSRRKLRLAMIEAAAHTDGGETG